MKRINSAVLSLVSIVGAGQLAGCSSSSYTSKDINLVSTNSVNALRDSEMRAYDVSQVKIPLATYEMAKNVSSIPETDFTLSYQDPSDSNRTVELRIDTHGSVNRSLDELISLKDELPSTFRARVLRLGAPDRGMLSGRSAGNQFSSNTGLKAVASYDGKPYIISAKKETGVIDGNRATTYNFSVRFGAAELEQNMNVFDPILALDASINGAAAYGISGQWVSGAMSPVGTIIDALVARIEGGGSNAPNGTWQRTIDLSANKDQKQAGLKWVTSQVNEFNANNLIIAREGMIYASGARNIRFSEQRVDFDIISIEGNFLANVAYSILTSAPSHLGTRLAVHAKDCKGNNDSSISSNDSPNNNGNNNFGGNKSGNTGQGLTGGSNSSSGGSPSQSLNGGSNASSGGSGNP